MAVIDRTPELRARLRAEVTLVADVLVPNWPISSFIAVNPLGGLEEHGFAGAIERAAAALGSRGHLPEKRFRELHGEGRITDADLVAALRRLRPAALEGGPVAAGSRSLGREDLLVLDLLHAPAAGSRPADGTAAEGCDALLGTSIAAAVDDEVDGWCAAFLDEGQATWAMPDREHGLYRAWRAVASRDRGLRRLGAGDLRAAVEALPERPEDALFAGLSLLGVGEDRRVDELRRHLGRRPGWASAIRWRAEHGAGSGAPADLTDLLAIRVSLEALLVAAAAERSGRGLDDLLEALSARRDAAADAGAGVEERAAAVEAAIGEGPGSLSAQGREALAALDPADRPLVWQAAYEDHWRTPLLAAMDRPARERAAARPAAQAVFCIDARSEGLRRHLEGTGPYETLGFAGFFVVAMNFRGLGARGSDALCPVLLTPRNDVTEEPAPGTGEVAERWLDAGRADAAQTSAIHAVREDLATPFAFAEAAGWVLGPQALARTFAPAAYGRGRERLQGGERPPTRMVIDRLTPEDAEALAAAQEREVVRAAVAARLGRAGRRASESDLEALRRRALGEESAAPAGLRLAGRRLEDLVRALREEGEVTARGHRARVTQAGQLGFSRDEQIALSKTALTMMGLTSGFARLVLLCGHGSRTENNPYEAALDCGACGGNQGGPNARAAAAMLNRPYVRDALRLEGIEVPEDTFFIAGQHDTAADTVRIFDTDLVPASHHDELARLQADLLAAGAANSAERLERLPNAPRGLRPQEAHRHAAARGRDWAQIRPEWGLARNAAFIVGPRTITEGLDLGCRTFLHSYDHRADKDGSGLETILTAPLVVAQWINCQYLFSTVDPEVFGSGNKTIHNVVAGLGVMQGPGGDLRLGLPIQGALVDDRELYHEPMRLLAIVEAPRERIDDIVRRNPILQRLFGGEWVGLAAREAPGDPWTRLTPDLTWEPWSGPAERDTGPPPGRADDRPAARVLAGAAA